MIQSPNSSVGNSASDMDNVRLHMNWCAGDWGHNEGADEAIDYINTAVAAGYPEVGALVEIINNIPGAAGEILKRPPIIDAARALAHVDSDLAVKLALTCQNNSPTVKNMLLQHSSAVAEWLRE
jgi:hypothetical protein